MNSLFHIIYVSSSKGLMSEEELAGLLKSIQTNNIENEITGMLLYREGNIMQVIEGEKHNIEQLFRRIELDERHTGIIKLVQEEISHRDFADWSMYYKNLSGLQEDGFVDFMSSESFNEQNVSRAKRWLLSFIN
jgi:hypothetical protein